jgi:hypothetical protein
LKLTSISLLISAKMVLPAMAAGLAGRPIDQYCDGIAARLQKQLSSSKR